MLYGASWQDESRALEAEFPAGCADQWTESGNADERRDSSVNLMDHLSPLAEGIAAVAGWIVGLFTAWIRGKTKHK